MMSLEQIQKTIQFLKTEIDAATDDSEVKTSYEKSLALAQAALEKRLQDAANDTKPEVNSTNETYRRSLNIKSIESALNDLSTFKGIDIKETTQYIERLEKIYTVMVKEVDASLEADYLKLVKVRLSDQVYKNMTTTNEDVSTFENYKSWVKKQYAGRLNAFQLLQRAFNVEFRPKEEKFTVYSQKVSEELRTALNAVREQYKKNTSQEIGVDSPTEFFAALLVTENLRLSCWPLYSLMVNDMEQLSTSAEVAQKAEFYRERLGGTWFGSQSDSLWSSQGSNLERKPYPKRNNFKSNADSKSSDDWIPDKKFNEKWKTSKEDKTQKKNQNFEQSDRKQKKRQSNNKASMHTVSSVNQTSEIVQSSTTPTSVFTPNVTPFH